MRFARSLQWSSAAAAIAVVVVVALTTTVVECSNILGVFPINGRSHWVVYGSAMEALARRGHNVTVITAFPRKAPLANYTEIDVSDELPSLVSAFSVDLVLQAMDTVFSTQRFIVDLQMNLCRKIHEIPKVQALFDGHVQFDAVFTEIFGADCDVGFAHYFKAPLLSIISSSHLPWSYDRTGGPDNPSYIPTIVTKAAGRMNFQERTINTLYYAYIKLFRKYVSDRLVDEFQKERFGSDTPYVDDIVQNTSVVFVNGHFSLDGSIPLPQNVVEIGGVHISPVKPIPKNILQFIEDSPNGVMLFSFGSLIRMSTVPSHVLQSFKDAFAKLPIRVLWKYEDEMPDKPDNVFISKWMPQGDILSHPKVRVFMTHGGLLGVLEAVNSGVPVVGIPFFFDQPRNILKLVGHGAGIMLDYQTITADDVYNAISTIINNDSYALNAKNLSKQFKDRPLNASESVVYWTEYVIRHNGAKQLRSAAIGMPWWQYFLLDVIGFILLIIFIVLYATYFIFKAIFKKLFKNSVPDTKKQN